MPIVWMRKLGLKHKFLKIMQFLTPTIKFGSDLQVHGLRYSILGVEGLIEESWGQERSELSGLGCSDFD